MPWSNAWEGHEQVAQRFPQSGIAALRAFRRVNWKSCPALLGRKRGFSRRSKSRPTLRDHNPDPALHLHRARQVLGEEALGVAGELVELGYGIDD